MAHLIDISLPLHPDLPTWLGSAGFQLLPTLRLATKDAANVFRLDCDVHVGAHIDAPWHFLPDGITVEQVPLDVLIGPVVVYLPEVGSVTAGDLAGLSLPPGTQRLLLRTRNSDWWAAGL